MTQRLRTVLFLLMLFCLVRQHGYGSGFRRIGIASAFGPELEAVESKLLSPDAQPIVKELDGTIFKEIDLDNRHFVLFLTGVSMVNAACTTQMAIDKFDLDAVLFSGIAGAVNPIFAPGDVIVPDQWVHQMESAWFNPDPQQPDEYLVPERFHPQYGHFGMIYPKDVRVVRSGETTPKLTHSFPADESLLGAARKGVANLKLQGPDNRVAKIQVGGTGVSGPVFLDNRAYREFEFETWNAECHEMEGTAVAQVAYIHRLPVLIIRGISDLAGGQEGENQEHVFTKLAAENAAAVLEATIRQLGSPGQ